jgi:predicted dehydrogenase
MTKKISVAVIGLGLMARYHIQQMLRQADTTEIKAVCEPSPDNYLLASKLFLEAGFDAPLNQPDFSQLIEEYTDRLDAVFIITPHAYHLPQARACMEVGLDVLLEKPMVMNALEASNLIDTRDRTGRLLVVAFPGSLSPNIRTAIALFNTGRLGNLQSISAIVWQNWGTLTVGTWRQQPALSGGGFLFDTGAHMLNTVVDLAGEDFVEVAAWMDNKNRPVETLGVVIGRLVSGALVTLHASGETIPSCASDIYAFYSNAIVRTGVWGERLEIQFSGRKKFRAVKVPPTLGVWEQFLAIREGRLVNPSPPEVGLRMAKLYDAIRASADHNGQTIKV